MSVVNNKAQVKAERLAAVLRKIGMLMCWVILAFGINSIALGVAQKVFSAYEGDYLNFYINEANDATKHMVYSKNSDKLKIEKIEQLKDKNLGYAFDQNEQKLKDILRNNKLEEDSIEIEKLNNFDSTVARMVSVSDAFYLLTNLLFIIFIFIAMWVYLLKIRPKLIDSDVMGAKGASSSRLTSDKLTSDKGLVMLWLSFSAVTIALLLVQPTSIVNSVYRDRMPIIMKEVNLTAFDLLSGKQKIINAAKGSENLAVQEASEIAKTETSIIERVMIKNQETETTVYKLNKFDYIKLLALLLIVNIMGPIIIYGIHKLMNRRSKEV